jgi:hypothetical protein
MDLFLKWKKNENIFVLGKLSKRENKYFFQIDKEGFRGAVLNGCIGIPGFELGKIYFESDELFKFFKNRIVSADADNIEGILQKYNLEKYDDMELLKATKAKLHGDNYFVEE